MFTAEASAHEQFLRDEQTSKQSSMRWFAQQKAECVVYPDNYMPEAGSALPASRRIGLLPNTRSTT